MRMRVNRLKLVVTIKKRIEAAEHQVASSRTEFPALFEAWKFKAIEALKRTTIRVRAARTVDQINSAMSTYDGGGLRLPQAPLIQKIDIDRLRCALRKLQICNEEHIWVDDHKDSYLQAACERED